MTQKNEMKIFKIKNFIKRISFLHEWIFLLLQVVTLKNHKWQILNEVTFTQPLSITAWEKFMARNMINSWCWLVGKLIISLFLSLFLYHTHIEWFKALPHHLESTLMCFFPLITIFCCCFQMNDGFTSYRRGIKKCSCILCNILLNFFSLTFCGDLLAVAAYKRDFLFLFDKENGDELALISK